jgi:hypothetical protein
MSPLVQSLPPLSFGSELEAGSFGTLKMSGGTVSSGAWFVIGRDSNGTADLSGGTINVTNRNFIVASTGIRGVADLNGSAVVNVTATGAGNGSVYVGEAFQSSPSIGELNLSGSAAVNIAGGDGLFLGVNAGGSGTVNFNGGTLTTPLVKKGAGLGAVTSTVVRSRQMPGAWRSCRALIRLM